MLVEPEHLGDGVDHGGDHAVGLVEVAACEVAGGVGDEDRGVVAAPGPVVGEEAA